MELAFARLRNEDREAEGLSEMNIVIVGAGIGGLTLALSLHCNGLARNITILEAAPSIAPLGVGVNLPPHATRELCELGLSDELASVGVETSQFMYFDSEGAELWSEARGLSAGYKWPQYSIHRGKLQNILYEAVLDRLGPDAVRTGSRVEGVTAGAATPRVTWRDADGLQTMTADLVVGADGVKSAVRDSLSERPAELAWNGWVMFRGTTRAQPFLDGRTMVLVSSDGMRVVAYPIEKPGLDGKMTLNWILSRRQDDHTLDRGNWSRKSDLNALVGFVEGWNFDWLDIEDMVRSGSEAYEYPMVDFDPLPRWNYGRATLLGDAAHAMYPFGSNGASQAILDARYLARELATREIDEALAEYEATRLKITAAVQRANRRQANETMDRVNQFAQSNALAGAREELSEREREYKRLAGFDMEELNNRASWTVKAKA